MKLGYPIVAAALSVLAAAPLRAGEMHDENNVVKVVEATATPAHVGGRTIIHFKIVNDGPARIYLAGIATPVAGMPRLMARVSATEAVDIGSIGIGPEETLDATSANLWYEITPLRRDLVCGDTFPVTFEFGDGRLTVPVQVHGGPEG
jgi:copper(I)-binding protein